MRFSDCRAQSSIELGVTHSASSHHNGDYFINGSYNNSNGSNGSSVTVSPEAQAALTQTMEAYRAVLLADQNAKLSSFCLRPAIYQPGLNFVSADLCVSQHVCVAHICDRCMHTTNAIRNTTSTSYRDNGSDHICQLVCLLFWTSTQQYIARSNQRLPSCSLRVCACDVSRQDTNTVCDVFPSPYM